MKLINKQQRDIMVNNMRTITVPRLPDEVYEKYDLIPPIKSESTYIIPSKSESLEYNRETYGEEYDHVEKRMVTGGLPLVWERK